MRSILEERGLWRQGMTLKEARDLLSNQEDFLGQKCWLEEVVSDAGHKIIFFPKFHCELNFFERVWAMTKARAREECDYSFAALRKLVPKIMEQVDVKSVRRMAQRCYRYMDAYRHGLSPALAEYAVRKYTSHRMIPAAVDRELNAMLERERETMAAAAVAERVQTNAEIEAAVQEAADNPIPADIADGVEPHTEYIIVHNVQSTPHTRFSHSNTQCEQCNEEESEERKFEHCERCNYVYHRTCLEPQPQPYGPYLFLCGYEGCKDELEERLGRPVV